MSLKSKAKELLKQARVYERVKASFLYDIFWSIADHQVIEARTREVEFYRDLLKGFRKGDLIFDIGANHGFKTDVFLRLGAKVLAVDPDESNQAILERTFLKYRIVKKPVCVVRKAVSDKNGWDTFWMDEPGSAKNTLNEKWVRILQTDEGKFGRSLGFRNSMAVETVRLEDLMSAYGVPYFVKIDVEGHEPSVLRGLKRPVPCLSFEVNLPEFRDEGLQCLQLLTQLYPDGRFNHSVSGQTRLVSERWVQPKEFRGILANCEESSIEVFWKTVC